MDCPECGHETVVFAVDPELRAYLPGDEPGASLCPRCLSVRPAVDPPAGEPDFSPLGDAFPDGGAAVPMALLLGLLSSLALYRDEIAALLERVERAGTDPLLVIDRLDADSGIESEVDLGRRRHQLEQLL
ncbi:DUF6276 family protein [Halomicrobium katesii]|uniref:DUF6276 family protein n=1 Tax=Halomicrobium katesii TaxID=437163 RepID=UPI0003714587|nr:DUF6276 family protein [Halomicrobium katesii]